MCSPQSYPLLLEDVGDGSFGSGACSYVYVGALKKFKVIIFTQQPPMMISICTVHAFCPCVIEVRRRGIT